MIIATRSSLFWCYDCGHREHSTWHRRWHQHSSLENTRRSPPPLPQKRGALKYPIEKERKSTGLLTQAPACFGAVLVGTWVVTQWYTFNRILIPFVVPPSVSRTPEGPYNEGDIYCATQGIHRVKNYSVFGGIYGRMVLGLINVPSLSIWPVQGKPRTPLRAHKLGGGRLRGVVLGTVGFGNRTIPTSAGFEGTSWGANRRGTIECPTETSGPWEPWEHTTDNLRFPLVKVV